MSEPSPIDQQRALLRDLAQLGAGRARNEPELERGSRIRQQQIDREFEEDYQSVIVRFASAKETADRTITEQREAIEARFKEEQESVELELSRTRRRVLAKYTHEKEEAQSTYREATWTIAAELEGRKTEIDAKFQEIEQQVKGQIQQLKTIHTEALNLLEKWGQYPEDDEASRPVAETESGLRKLPQCIKAAQEQLDELRSLMVPRFARGARLPVLFVVLGLALLVPAWLLGDHQWQNGLYGVGICVAVVLVAGTGITFWLKSLARSQVHDLYHPLWQAVVDAEPSRARIMQHYAKKKQAKVADAQKRHDHEVRRAHRRYKKKRILSKQQRIRSLKEMKAKFQRDRKDSQQRYHSDLAQAEETYQRQRTTMQSRYESDSQHIQSRHNRLLEENKKEHETEKRALTASWEQGLARAQKTIADIHSACRQLFPDWNDPSWQEWVPAKELPPALRFGEYRVSMERITNGALPAESSGAAKLPDFSFPALSGFPEDCSILFHAKDEGRAHAVDALQVLMFRLLTAVPPGKVRFTILDPVGLGQNFAAFMHLADYEEALVASRIWTELAHIEQRLADLTAHMENVIQKYLRNQFLTIEEYNAQAGEVAEPFRVLVVANFPANFSSEAARRLVSICQSGRRCGVHTLITVDARQTLPSGFNLADLEQESVVLTWDGQRFTWGDEELGKYPLKLDAPPPDELCTRILQIVGEKAREANRVEVPFEFISPTRDQWWTCDTRSGISVPLGRAGATKRQHLKLGQGTAQHVLVAGKTGSGKSTLLHALITNLALLYTPDEVQLYLIDFKKGVEFKTYATHELPHARVVAIESEREFGLSVLQRLDAELRLRGESFRGVGAQDVAAYRQATGKFLPRIILIVDEFQEFFVEDDRIAQEAAQLLDRLVRQGRAFGLHVLLGSQTLGGAYTLARSTIDQMAVRIALQCSEADAHLILSDENSAARLLSRPGEAIYNDANGLVEGNNPFQVVWLSEEKREEHLRQVRELACQRYAGALPPPLVFEGNLPANLTRNHLLEQLLQAPAWQATPRALQAWLGEAISIKDATAATFRPQTASNLLIVGQADDAALALMVTTLVSLAAQLAPTATPQFYVVDGSPVDSPHAGYLAQLRDVLPHGLRTGLWRDVPAIVGEVADEVDRRQKVTDGAQAPVFLFLHGLQRFRDLRRSEDDFGFGRREEKPSPAQQFATIVREGAGLGVHTIVWCDTLNNLQRSLERAALREFEMRVLFQMSVADSSNLIDTPLASKLGVHRAYFFSEEQGRLEKCRPYGLPPQTWLEHVRERLSVRTQGGVQVSS
jgi:S-DNA-T family DNA segregation ATPase FtsK/SpoIIIE